MAGLLDMINDPRMGLAAGLLAARAPGGTFGGGLNSGLRNMQAMQQGAAQRSLLEERAEEMRQQRAQREQSKRALSTFLGQQGQFSQIAPGSPEEFAAFGQDNYAGDVTGGVRMDQAPTGMYAQNPQMAGLLDAMGPEAATGLLGKMYLQQMQPQDPYSSIGKLQADRAAGLINEDQYNTALQSMAPSGMSISVGPDGGIQLVQGPNAGNFKPSNKSINDLQNNVMKSEDLLANLKQVSEMFKPEYLTYGGGVKQSAGRTLEKLGVSPPEDMRRYTQDRAAFMAASLGNLNDYIHEVTGAQMSVYEADRIRKAMPDPENNSPSEFVGKYNTVIDKVMAARRRAQYALENGIPNPKSLPMSDFEGGDNSQYYLSLGDVGGQGSPEDGGNAQPQDGWGIRKVD